MGRAGMARRLARYPNLIEAGALLAATRLLIAASPRAATARLLRRATRSSGAAGNCDPKARDVANAVSRVSSLLGRTTCLSRALTGWFMLRRRGIESVVRLGAQREERGELRLHAWLEHGGCALIDSEDAGGYVPLVR